MKANVTINSEFKY